MNTNKLTEKTIEVIQKARSLASENGNPQIEQEHILSAPLKYDGSVIGQLIERIKRLFRQTPIWPFQSCPR